MEFETYGDVIDAFERDNMGYETLTDYIRGENIKIAEIDMSPMGDLAKAFNKKDGGMMIAIEQLGQGGITGGKTYHQYHDSFVPRDEESMGYANGGGVGSMMQPKKKFVEQDGFLNYIKNSDSVTVPKRFKARENAPATKLAYITDAEAKMLKKQNKGTPHKGPKGIPSYDSFDAQGGYTSGTAMSAAETGSSNARDRAEVRASNIGGPKGLAPGVKSQEEIALRNAAIVAGAGQRVNPGFFDSRNTISPQELALARASDPRTFNRVRGTGGIMGFLRTGGIFGNLLRGLGQKFGLGKTYDQPTYDMSEFNKLGLGGIDPFANIDIRDKFDRKKINVTNEKPTANITGKNLNDFQIGDPGKYATADALTEANMADYQTSLVDEFTPGGIDRTNLYEDFIDNRDLISETATSPQFNTSLINEFGVKDRGIFDANQGLQYGSIPGNTNQGFGLMNSDAAKAAAMAVMSNAFNENVMPGTSDMNYPDRNMDFPDTGMLVADASKNANQQTLENIINKDMYDKNLQPFFDKQKKTNEAITNPDLLKDLGIIT